MTVEMIAPSVEERIEALRDRHGEAVPIEDLGEVVVSILDTLQGDLSVGRDQANGSVHKELSDLADYIESTRQELSTIRPHHTRLEEIPKATDQLGAVVAATEEATGRILDAAEEMEAIAKVAEPDIAERVLAVVTNIYEASNFQDITGQRITKVIKTLEYVEEKIGQMAALMGHTEGDFEAEDDASAAEEEDLLQGPQMVGDGNSQDDIDALLADFD